MRLTKAFAAAAALFAAALVGGTLISTAFAQTDGEADTDADSSASAYCETFAESFAAELGVSVDDLVPAGKAAALSTIDAAVAAGDLDEDRADALRERIEAFDGDGCGILGSWHRAFGAGFLHGAGRGEVHVGVFDAAAAALGIEASELRELLHDGSSLEEIAGERGVGYDDVKAAVLSAIGEDLDAAVESGDITQERADAVLEQITTWLDEGGEHGLFRGGRGHGFGHRFGNGFGNGFGPFGDDE